MGWAFDEYILDLECRELRRGETPVKLEPQALDLLAYLVAHRGRVIGKDELIREIWRGRIVSDAALTTRINAVRQAVGDNGKSQRLIRTFSRKGIRFIGEVSEARPPRVPQGQETIRIFVSSPSDVRPERLKTEQVIRRLDGEFANRFQVKELLWEHEPLLEAHRPEVIPAPHLSDVVVVILWARLGVPLPEDRFRGAISGSQVTGIEWEVEDAIACAREKGVPALLLYRKRAPAVAEMHDRKAVRDQLAQLEAVDEFVCRWFGEESGAGRLAISRSFETLPDFEEKLYADLRALLERRAGISAEGFRIRWPAPPYRALLSYDYEHAAVFFGRARAREALRQLLSKQIKSGTAFVLVLGASGSGKSSLVKAGLVPDLALPGMIEQVGLVRRAQMRPSDAGGCPIAALAAALLARTALPELHAVHYTPERLSALLRDVPEQALVPIRQGLAAAGKAAGLTEAADARLIVVIDQLEEIFTINDLGDNDREAFIQALAALSKSGLVWVVATMRSDFFDRLETATALAALSAEGRFLLMPPDEAELAQIIRQPALEAGLRFERDATTGLGLDETLRQAAAKGRAALPLLSFLLDQLWQKRSETGLLTFDTYEEVGGFEGAIGRRAEEVVQGQPKEVQQELTWLLRELVTIESGRPVSRAAPLPPFFESSPRGALIEAFLDPRARLLTSDGDAGGAQLRLAHEALLTNWSRAREQIASDTRDLELRRLLEEEAERWGAAPQREKKGRVITGMQLVDALALSARWGEALPGKIKEFVAASRAAARKRRLHLWMTVMAAPLVVALVTGIVWAGLEWWGVREVEAEMKFVTIPAGCYDMGSPDSEAGRESNEGPVHRVCLNPFDIARYEITQDEWRRVMIFPNRSDPSHFKGDDRPVEQIDWKEARRFVTLMSLFGRREYRLPSEAEWEYAARAGTTTSRYWGNNIDDGCVYENIADQSLKKINPQNVSVFANCDDGYVETAPVGRFKPNPWGLYDMLGNVANWLEDCYSNDYGQTPTDGTANTKGPCTNRIFRGGAFNNSPRFVRSANRNNYFGPDGRYAKIGLRIARTVIP